MCSKKLKEQDLQHDLILKGQCFLEVVSSTMVDLGVLGDESEQEQIYPPIANMNSFGSVSLDWHHYRSAPEPGLGLVGGFLVAKPFPIGLSLKKQYEIPFQ